VTVSLTLIVIPCGEKLSTFALTPMLAAEAANGVMANISAVASKHNK